MKLYTGVLCAALVLAVSSGSLSQSSPPASAPSATMKAVQVTGFGGVDKLVYGDVARPIARAGEVLVRVHAAGVNPVDWKVRQGMLAGMGPEVPFVLGYDVSGVVAELGEGVSNFAIGDEVFAYLSLQRAGGYAEYAAVPTSELARKPVGIDHLHGAATPLAALTAWQALFDTADLRAGQTVLIHAGAGGVGHFAVQLAKWKGARVIATASAGNLEFLRALGADVVVDYAAQKFEDAAHEVDVVFDPIGGETRKRSYGVLKPGGMLVSIVGEPSQKECEAHDILGAGILVQPNGAELSQIAQLMASGQVRAYVSDVVPLAEAGRAHQLSEDGHGRGKIVLSVR